jgi:hypothetical protein
MDSSRARLSSACPQASTSDKDPTPLRDLEGLVEPTTWGDPESPLRWTAKSVCRVPTEAPPTRAGSSSKARIHRFRRGGARAAPSCRAPGAPPLRGERPDPAGDVGEAAPRFARRVRPLQLPDEARNYRLVDVLRGEAPPREPSTERINCPQGRTPSGGGSTARN